MSIVNAKYVLSCRKMLSLAVASMGQSEFDAVTHGALALMKASSDVLLERLERASQE